MSKSDAAVLSYMKQQNRPYSALDIFNNLHKAHGKTAIVKSLEALASQGKLLEKTYGKSKIYVYHQSQFADVSEEAIAKLDVELKALQAKVDDSASKVSSANRTLNGLLAEPTTDAAVETLKELRKSHSEVLATFNKVSDPNRKKVDPGEKKKMTMKRDELSKLMRKRKRSATDLMNAVLEGYPKSKKHFIEEVGLEID